MNKNKTDVLFITNIKSYHQVDLFDAIAEKADISIHVFYLLELTEGRYWTELPSPTHPHTSLKAWFSNTRFFLNPALFFKIIKLRPKMIVICQYVGLSNLFAMLLSSMLGIKWVFWSESPGVKFFEVKSKIPDWVRSFCRRILFLPIKHLATSIWGIGPIATQQYENFLNRHVINIPYYSDLKKFDRDTGYTPNGIVRILFCGRLSFRKGFDIVLKIINSLSTNETISNWQFTICGDGEFKDKIRQLSTKAAQKTIWLGFRQLNEMPGIYKDNDILICPSRYDGWGMVVPEAMAAGLTVITSTEMGSAQHIFTYENINNGFHIFQPTDIESMTELLIKYIKSPFLLQQVGTKSRVASKNYDSEYGSKAITQKASAILNEISREY